MEISVVDDANSMLALRPGEENGRYVATGGDDAIRLAFGGDGTGADGLGVDTRYAFDDVVRLRNQGTQSVYVWATVESTVFDADGAYLYPGDAETPLSDARPSRSTSARRSRWASSSTRATSTRGRTTRP